MVDKHIRVLLIENDLGDVQLIKKAFNGNMKKSFSLEHVDSLSKGLEILHSKEIDIVLLGASLLDCKGINSFFRIHALVPGIPAIFLSGHDDEVFALKAMKVGVQDFIVKKQINSNLLIRSIRYAIERQRLTVDLMSMSFVDKLTGVFNRRGLFALAERQLEIADRTKRGLFVVYADLDNMKMINDTLGHSAGDRALKETVEILKSTFRRSDIIARVGGDEFVVVAIEAKEDSEEVFHARLQEKVRSHNACRYGESYRLSVSIGVAGYDTEYPCSFDELLARADKNMFEQKRMKRGSCRDYIDCKRMVLETV